MGRRWAGDSPPFVFIAYYFNQVLGQRNRLSDQMLQKIEQLAEQVVAREGCKLYDLEFKGGAGGRILRVYIDKEIPGGATLDDCANVSRGLNLLLDVEDVITGGPYSLEISTPGIERPLKRAWHFASAVGKKVWLKFDRNLEALGVKSKRYGAHKQLTEVLQACEETGIRLQLDDESILIPFSAIEKSHVVFEFGTEKGKKKQ